MGSRVMLHGWESGPRGLPHATAEGKVGEDTDIKRRRTRRLATARELRASRAHGGVCGHRTKCAQAAQCG